VQTPEPLPPESEPGPYGPEPYEPAGYPRPGYGGGDGLLPGLGERLTWISGLVLALSAFMGWYVGSGEGLSIAVIGWHTGVLGKLVFFIGLALIALVLLHEAGIALPATVPESLVVIALGALATIFVLIRLITIPQSLLPADGRGIGIWVSLVAALLAIGAGIVRAGEEMR
jgi:hypothetical protein